MAINGSVSRKTRTGYGGRKSSPPGWKEPRNSVLQRRTRKSPRKRVCDSRRSLGRVKPLRTIERLRAGCVLRGPRNKAFKSSIHRGYQPLAHAPYGSSQPSAATGLRRERVSPSPRCGPPPIDGPGFLAIPGKKLVQPQIIDSLGDRGGNAVQDHGLQPLPVRRLVCQRYLVHFSPLNE